MPTNQNSELSPVIKRSEKIKTVVYKEGHNAAAVSCMIASRHQKGSFVWSRKLGYPRGCLSFDCKLDLYVLAGNLTGQKYRDNVLASRVVPHFDNHALADRPMFMDDNARPQRARIVHYYLQQEAAQKIP
jgi:hypothetical protein